MKKIDGGIHAVSGVQSAAVHAGIRFNPDKKDLALFYFENGATIAGVFTKNQVKAWPVLYDIEQLNKQSEFKAILVNSGNANACNGENGNESMLQSIEETAKVLNISPEEVLVSSTGVIGAHFSAEPFKNYLPVLKENLQDTSSADAAAAILTTDTVPKEVAYELVLDGQIVRIGAMAKGSGMIHPNLGTMLAYLVMNVACDQDMLNTLLLNAVEPSFNSISVDGDTSTNDTVLLATTNDVKVQLNEKNIAALQALITQVAIDLAQMIVADGEGASKFVSIVVSGTKQVADATQAAKAIATSSLVKTAIFGEDPNWGRILSAVGNSGIENLNPQTVDIYFQSDKGRLLVCENGAGLPFDEDKAHEILTENEITIEVNLKSGTESATVWTSDLTHEYVTINAEYRT